METDEWRMTDMDTDMNSGYESLDTEMDMENDRYTDDGHGHRFGFQDRMQWSGYQCVCDRIG